MVDQLIFGRVSKSAKAEQTSMISKLFDRRGLGRRLIRSAANAGDSNYSMFKGIGADKLFGCQGKHRFKEGDLRVANGKLSRMDPYSHTARPGGDIIPQKSALAALIQAASGIERQRARWNDSAFLKQPPDSRGHE
jgi:hypothetical protein